MANIDGDASSNTLTGTSGGDRIRGLGGNDWLYGLGGRDRLEGGAGNDYLYGGGGRDLLIGGRGRDHMWGGAGPDTFLFDDEDTGDATAGPLSDVIYDFSAEDTLDLMAVDILDFWGWGDREPGRGSFSIWQAGGSTFVTWNTFDGYRDVELRGFTGDPFSQIRWYEDDYSADVNTTGRLALGQTVDGTIERNEDRDWFQVTLEAGYLYTFDLRGESGGGGTLLDPYLALFDAEGNFLAEDWDGSGTFDARLIFYPEASGTYYISADGSGWTSGTYELALTGVPYVDDYAGDTSTTGAIAPGDVVTGDVGHPNDQDWFQVTFEAGQIYRFDIQGEADGGGTVVDPYLVLYDAGGNWVWDGYEELSYVADVAGTFYISAQSFGALGTYTLEVTSELYVDDYAGDTTTTGVIAAGETVTGEIGAPGDQDWIRIELIAGETYAFDLGGVDSGSGTLPDPVLELYDADGDFIDGNDDWNGYDSHLDHTAAATGTYFLVARAFADAYTGTYSLSADFGAALI